MIRTYLRAAGAVSALCVLATPAFSHSTLEVREAELGSTYKAILRIPHGCGDEATHTVRVQIPEGFFNVKPMPHAGWVLETVAGDYEKTYINHGREVTAGVKEIVWSGGNLPNEWYDEFVFRGTFAPDLEAGSTFYFPTIQECANGSERWLGTGGNSEEKPAPKLTLIEAPSHAH